MQRKRWLMVIGLVLLGCSTAEQPTLPPVAIPTRPVPAATVQAQRLPRPTGTPAPSATPIRPTPVAPSLLADRDPGHPKLRFGPAAPNSRWVIVKTQPEAAEPRFGIWSTIPPVTSPITDQIGLPLGWSADGLLLLFADPAAPTSLLALDPATGFTTTVLTATQGTLVGAVWPRTGPIVYAQQSDGLLISSIKAGNQRFPVAQLSERRLVEDGLVAGPSPGMLAMLVSSTLSPTLELYLVDVEHGQLALVDQSTVLSSTPGLVWSPYGELFYDLGQGLKLYDPGLKLIDPLGLEARPLTWAGQGLLARQHANGALLRWSNEIVQPFTNSAGPLVVDDAQAGFGPQALLNINGQVWQIHIP